MKRWRTEEIWEINFLPVFLQTGWNFSNFNEKKVWRENFQKNNVKNFSFPAFQCALVRSGTSPGHGWGLSVWQMKRLSSCNCSVGKRTEMPFLTPLPSTVHLEVWNYYFQSVTLSLYLQLLRDLEIKARTDLRHLPVVRAIDFCVCLLLIRKVAILIQIVSKWWVYVAFPGGWGEEQKTPYAIFTLNRKSPFVREKCHW